MPRGWANRDGEWSVYPRARALIDGQWREAILLAHSMDTDEYQALAVNEMGYAAMAEASRCSPEQIMSTAGKPDPIKWRDA